MTAMSMTEALPQLPSVFSPLAKALLDGFSEREEAVLQALDLLTRDANEITWIKGTDLREKVRGILGQTPDQMGNAQWIGHVLNRLQLTDNSRRKHHVGGKLYAIDRREVLDMMQRYDVPPIENNMVK